VEVAESADRPSASALAETVTEIKKLGYAVNLSNYYMWCFGCADDQPKNP